MLSRGPGDSKNVKTSQAYFFEGFTSFFEDFTLTIFVHWQTGYDGFMFLIFKEVHDVKKFITTYL